MYYDLEVLIRRLNKAMDNFSTNEEGKHVTTIESAKMSVNTFFILKTS